MFPYLQQAGLSLTPALEKLVAILDLLRIAELVSARRFHQVGALPKDRAPLARAFLAMHCLNQPDTNAFHDHLLTDKPLRLICGWDTPEDVPSPSTFSRAFARFADLELADQVHAQRVKEWLDDTLVRHQALDATDIAFREADQPNFEPQYGRSVSGKRRKHLVSGRPTGWPKSGEVVEKPLTRIE